MPGICQRKVRYITVIRIVLISPELNITKNVYVKQIRADEYFTDTQQFLSNEFHCFYRVSGLGMGNTYTLHDGDDLGVIKFYIAIVCLWFIIVPWIFCCMCAKK
jgi:hypothetical protein